MDQKKYTLRDLIVAVLETADRPLTPKEIWQQATDRKLDGKLKKSLRTPESSIGPTLHFGLQGDPPLFDKYGRYPARFFLKTRAADMPSEERLDAIEAEANLKKEKSPWDEKDLYPLLAYYVSSIDSFNKGKSIYTKAIPHEQSKKSGYSQWVYPDMVGFYRPLGDFGDEVVSLSSMLGDNLLRLYSFELKKRIDKGTYRESFFQAVSNSSWANEGYLVTAEIADDQDLLSELGRLSEAFGIGIITLENFINPDSENLNSSPIAFPATPKVSIDWETMNKISEENEVFRAFVHNITEDSTRTKINRENYETVLDSDELAAYIKDKITSKQ